MSGDDNQQTPAPAPAPSNPIPPADGVIIQHDTGNPMPASITPLNPIPEADGLIKHIR